MPGVINLLPEQEQKQARVNPYVAWFFKTGVYFLLATYGLVLLVLAFRWYRETQLADLNRVLRTQIENYRQNLDMLAEYRTLQQKYTFIDQVTAATPVSFTYLELIESTIPEPVILDQILLTYPGLVIKGNTTDYLAISAWRTALDRSEHTQMVEVKNVDRSRISVQGDQTGNMSEGVQFVIEITLQS